MPFWTDWLTVLGIGLLAVVSPGPNLAVVIRNSVGHGRRAGVNTALGLAAGNLIHATYCLIGIGVIITQSIVLFNAVKYLGAAYLIYIGVKSLRARKHTPGGAAVPLPRSMSRVQALRTGFLTNLLNPKVTLFFLALFTQIIRPGTPLSAQTIYGLTMVVLEFAWFALVAVLLGHSAISRRFMSIAHWIERTTGLVLIALGLRVAFSRNT